MAAKGSNLPVAECNMLQQLPTYFDITPKESFLMVCDVNI